MIIRRHTVEDLTDCKNTSVFSIRDQLNHYLPVCSKKLNDGRYNQLMFNPWKGFYYLFSYDYEENMTAKLEFNDLFHAIEAYNIAE